MNNCYFLKYKSGTKLQVFLIKIKEDKKLSLPMIWREIRTRPYYNVTRDSHLEHGWHWSDLFLLDDESVKEDIQTLSKRPADFFNVIFEKDD